MKFKQYLKSLNDYAKKNPESLKLETIYSGDDEGNTYSNVIMGPPEEVKVDLNDNGIITSDEVDFDNPVVNAIIIN